MQTSSMDNATGIIPGVQLFMAELLVGDGEEVVLVVWDEDVLELDNDDDDDPLDAVAELEADAEAELEALWPTKIPARVTGSSELPEF